MPSEHLRLVPSHTELTHQVSPDPAAVGGPDVLRELNLRTLAQALADSTQVGAFVKAVDGTVLWANDAVESITGFKPDEFIGCRVGDLLSSEKTDPHARVRMKQHYDAGLPLTIRVCGRKKSGDSLWAEVELIPQRSRDGKLQAFVTLLKDITGEMLTGHSTGHEARDQLLAAFSHDVRTPVSSAMNLLELLQDTVLTGEQADLVRKAQESLVAVRLLISGSLAASVSSLQERADTRTERVDIEELFKTVLSSLISLTTHRQDVTLTFTCDPRVKTVEVHRESLYRVLSNLAGNALKFTCAGHVWLRAEPVSTHISEEALGWRPVRFSVTDTGCGVDEAAIARITAPFEKNLEHKAAAGSDVANFEGLGLGLALVRQMLNSQGCELRVKSTVGVGSEFSFDLLCRCDFDAAEQQAKAIPIDEKPADSIEKRLAGLLVLVVDDNQMSRLVARKQLERLGMQVLEAVDGLHALDVLAQQQWRTPDIILLDINMPRMDGPSLAAKLQADAQWKEIPLVALSAALDEPAVALMYSAGVRRFVEKPFERHHLVRALADLLQSPAGGVTTLNAEGLRF